MSIIGLMINYFQASNGNKVMMMMIITGVGIGIGTGDDDDDDGFFSGSVL